MNGVKNDVIKKLSRKQVFVLCLIWVLFLAFGLVLVCLFAPESLPAFFEVLCL